MKGVLRGGAPCVKEVNVMNVRECFGLKEEG